MVTPADKHCSLHEVFAKDITCLQSDSRDYDKRLTVVEVIQAGHESDLSTLSGRVKINEEKNAQQDIAVALLTTAIDSLNKTVDKLDSTVNRMMWKMIGGTTAGVSIGGGAIWGIYEMIKRLV